MKKKISVLTSDMGKHVKGQVIQVCNGAFL